MRVVFGTTLLLNAIATAILSNTLSSLLPVLIVEAADGNNIDDAPQQQLALNPWQECSIFLAPSPTGGYGVFAARDFQESEIVELAPFYLPTPNDTPFTHNTALHDYVYGYIRARAEGISDEDMTVVVWGGTMIYNHHQDQNILWNAYGLEPGTYGDPTSLHLVGFEALRYIRKGEELLSSYGLDDGGAEWFRGRNINMTEAPPEASTIPLEQLSEYKQLYCSKIYADIDDHVFSERVEPNLKLPNIYDDARLAPSTITLAHNDGFYNYDDHHYPWAIAKVPITKGDRIEVAPALVLDRNLVVNTAMAPLVYYWHELDKEQQDAVRELRKLGYYTVAFQGPSSDWQREDRFTSFEDSVIVPVGGWIGRVERVGQVRNYLHDSHNQTDDGAASAAAVASAANCKIRILPSDFYKELSQSQRQQLQDAKAKNPFSLGNAGIVLELIATRNVSVGERLRIDLPSVVGTFKERLALYKILEETGQIYSLVDHHELHYHHQLTKKKKADAESSILDDEL